MQEIAVNLQLFVIIGLFIIGETYLDISNALLVKGTTTTLLGITYYPSLHL